MTNQNQTRTEPTTPESDTNSVRVLIEMKGGSVPGYTEWIDVSGLLRGTDPVGAASGDRLREYIDDRREHEFNAMECHAVEVDGVPKALGERLKLGRPLTPSDAERIMRYAELIRGRQSEVVDAYFRAEFFCYVEPDQWAADLDDRLAGVFDSAGEYVMNYYEQTGHLHEVPSEILVHTDFDAIARDWVMNGGIDIMPTESGSVVVFYTM